MNQLSQILIKRLEKRGMEPDIIPGFIRTLANSILVNSNTNLSQVNNRLHFLGWDGFDLDYHTMELAIACFEAEGLKDLEYKSACWFENRFKPDQGCVING